MPKLFVKFDDAARTVPTVWTYNFFSDAHLLPTGQLSADLKDDTNAATGVSLHIDTAFGNSGGGSSNATAGTGEFDESVLDSAMFTTNGGVGRLRLAGIPNGASYTLQLTGHTSNSARHTSFTVEGSSQDYLVGSAAAPTAPVSFTGTVDPDGEIIIDVTKAASGSFYGYVNGFILEYTTGPTSETATTGNIPLTIQAGYTKVDLVDPVTTNASLLFGVTGDAPVTGDDLEYDVTSVLDSGVTLSVAASGVWTVTEAVDGNWTTDIVVSRRVVQQDGTIGAEAAITFQAPTQGGGGGGSTPQYNVEHLIQWVKENGTGNSTTEKLLTYLKSAGATQEGATELLYEFLKANSAKLDHMERYWDVSQSIADGDAGFPYTLPINF